MCSLSPGSGSRWQLWARTAKRCLLFLSSPIRKEFVFSFVHTAEYLSISFIPHHYLSIYLRSSKCENILVCGDISFFSVESPAPLPPPTDNASARDTDSRPARGAGAPDGSGRERKWKASEIETKPRIYYIILYNRSWACFLLGRPEQITHSIANKTKRMERKEWKRVCQGINGGAVCAPRTRGRGAEEWMNALAAKPLASFEF